MTDERTKPFTAQELADVAGVDDSYIRRLLAQGRLSGQKFGDVWSIPADEARRWLSERSRGRRRKTK